MDETNARTNTTQTLELTRTHISRSTEATNCLERLTVLLAIFGADELHVATFTVFLEILIVDAVGACCDGVLWQASGVLGTRQCHHQEKQRQR